MKCCHHAETEAMGVCMHCGRALCADCAQHTPTNRLACSDACLMKLQEQEDSLTLLNTRTVTGYKAAAFLLLLCGLAFLGTGVMQISKRGCTLAGASPLFYSAIFIGISLLCFRLARIKSKVKPTP